MDDWQRPLLRWLIWNLASMLLLWAGYSFGFGQPQSGDLCMPPDNAPDGSGFVFLFITVTGIAAMLGGSLLYAMVGRALHLRANNAWAAWLGWIVVQPLWLFTVVHTINACALPICKD